jgi:hypothetical protein
MRLTATLLILGALILAPLAPARAYTLQYTSTSATTQIHWPATTIKVSLSTSLSNPPSFVHATGAQCVLAARRALSRWALASNIQFVVTTDDPRQDVSLPGTNGDGVSLITIADTPNNRTFFGGQGLRPGKANVIFDNNGNIVEADIAVNPLVTRLTATGQEVSSFFSTDGTSGSYDLESTFTHEIGHLLGLEHSGILSATMQARQGTNGTFNLPNFTTRTLSSDDVAGVRSIYGPRAGLGSIAGRVSYAGDGPAFGAHVFAEDVATGRTVAGNVSLADGRYRIDDLPPGQYRVVAERLDEPVLADQIGSNAGGYQGLSASNTAPFLTTEAGTLGVAADAAFPLDIAVPGGATPFNPTFIGTGSSGQLSTVAVPVVPGTPMTILVGGDNLGVVPSNGVSINSPFITVSNVQQIPGFGIPVISFDITPSVLTPPGEYSVRFQSSAGQVAYISGGLTVDLPNGVPASGPNLIDSTQFFVAQHYRDFLSREPDAAGLQFWTNNIESCGSDAGCRAAKRVDTSAAFFLSIEFQNTGYLVYRIYKAAFGSLPGKPVPVIFQQFFPDTQQIGRGVIVGQGNWQAQLEANKVAFTQGFVQRPEFVARYPRTMSASDFVNTLDANAGGVLSASDKTTLTNELAPNPADTTARADVLRKVAENQTLQQREFNSAFVLMQYFGYLRRNPDDPPDADFSGYNFWLAKLNQFNGNYVQAQMVQAFLSALEYRQRFGPA